MPDNDEYRVLDDDMIEEIEERDGREAALKAIDDPEGYFKSLEDKKPTNGEPDRPRGGTPDGEEPEEKPFVNPFADSGVPDDMLIDPKTNMPYENGMILGKYKTPEEAWKGFREVQKDIGRPKSEEADLPSLTPSDAPQQLTRDERRQLKEITFQNVLDRYAPEISELGFDPADYGTLEEFNNLKSQNRALYDAIQRDLDAEFDGRQRAVLAYTQTYAQRDRLSEQGSNDGFQTWVDDLTEMSGIEPDEEDLSRLRATWDEDVKTILDYDKKMQDEVAKGNNVFEDEATRAWYARYFDFKDSVPVLSRDKLFRELSLRHKDIRNTVMRNAARNEVVGPFERAMEQDRKERPRFPESIGTEQESSVTGQHFPSFTLEDWNEGRVTWEDLVEAAGGDADRAQKYFDTVIERENKRYKPAPRRSEANEY